MCIPLAYLTAYQMLTRYRSLPRGATILVIGSASVGAVNAVAATAAARTLVFMLSSLEPIGPQKKPLVVLSVPHNSSTRQFDLRKQRLVAERKQRGRSNGNTSLSTAANCFTSQHAPCTVQPCPDRFRLYPKNARGLVDACFLHVTHNEDGAKHWR